MARDEGGVGTRWGPGGWYQGIGIDAGGMRLFASFSVLSLLTLERFLWSPGNPESCTVHVPQGSTTGKSSRQAGVGIPFSRWAGMGWRYLEVLCGLWLGGRGQLGW
jgi:hypothetical protein